MALSRPAAAAERRPGENPLRAEQLSILVSIGVAPLTLLPVGGFGRETKLRSSGQGQEFSGAHYDVARELTQVRHATIDFSFF